MFSIEKIRKQIVLYRDLLAINYLLHLLDYMSVCAMYTSTFQNSKSICYVNIQSGLKINFKKTIKNFHIFHLKSISKISDHFCLQKNNFPENL